jgi:L-rhamnose-H+ transport protein
MIILHSEDLLLPPGLLLMTSMPILFAGLWLYARAGLKREKEQSAPATAASTPKGSFLAGLALCIYTGVLAPCFNLGFVYGNQVATKSLEMGANTVTSTYAVFLLVLGAGFIPNALYCAYLVTRERGWGLFTQPGATKEVLIAAGMAILWCSAVFGYGIGANMAGRYGTSIGYALWGATTVIASTVGGIFTGEWKGTSGSTRKLLAVAMSLVLVSLIVMDLGGIF